jgi:hypothetical protein
VLLLEEIAQLGVLGRVLNCVQLRHERHEKDSAELFRQRICFLFSLVVFVFLLDFFELFENWEFFFGRREKRNGAVEPFLAQVIADALVDLAGNSVLPQLVLELTKNEIPTI